MRRRRRSNSRKGLTLIETLVAIGMIGILVALLMPAVQAAREVARRAHCQSNLRQVGIALHAYHASMNCFPISWSSGRPTATPRYLGYYSVHSRLLPYLDQQSLFGSINFDVGAVPLDTLGAAPVTADYEPIAAINRTAMRTTIGTFLCPSDGGAFADTGTNYRANVGVGPWPLTLAEFPDSGNGLFEELRVTRMASVPDGLSHTAAFSERVRGTGRRDSLSATRDAWLNDHQTFNGDQQLQSCSIAARVEIPADFVTSGAWWFWSGRERTLYTHTQPPNGRVPDCIWPQAITAPGMATARATHPGGVNAVMGDGSTRFVSNSIDRSIWRALGTRNGKEIVD